MVRRQRPSDSQWGSAGLPAAGGQAVSARARVAGANAAGGAPPADSGSSESEAMVSFARPVSSQSQQGHSQPVVDSHGQSFPAASGSGHLQPPRSQTTRSQSQPVHNRLGSRPPRREEEGPPILVALLGVAGSRWAGVRAEHLAKAPQLSNVFSQADTGSGDRRLFGFAVMRSWRPFCRSLSPTRASLRFELGRQHRRCGPCFFLEHELLDCCTLEEPASVGDGALSGRAAALRASQFADQFQDAMARRPGQCSQLVRDIIARWRSQFSLQPSVFIWPAAPLFAAGLARGLVRHDVTIVLRRKSVRDAWVAPVQPSRRLRQSLLSSGQAALVHAAEAQVNLRSVRPRVATNLSLERYTAEELVASIRQAQNLKSQAFNRDTARAVLDNPLSGLAAAGLDSTKFGTRQVGGTALRVSRKRLDIAAMLSNRERYVHSGPFYRYVATDASPQVGQSIEIFVSVERVVQRSAVRGQAAGVPGDAIRSRILPLVTLGSGMAGLTDKVAAHLHQVFLDYGPSVGHVLAACSDVRQVMSDMGTELGIANFGNAIGHVLGEQLDWTGEAVPWAVPEERAEDRVRFLYPFALQTPGLLHIVDWVIQSTISQLPWWPAWQLECKRLLQFVHGQAHRDRLCALIMQRAAPSQATILSASLVLGTGRFAAWRWKTLSKAVSDLQRIEGAMRYLAGELGSFVGHVASRDTKGIAQIYATCSGSSFWDRAAAIRAVIAPLMNFMGWLQGCDCHEEQLRQGQVVSCPFKGCRARALSARLQALRAELQALRQSLRPDSFGCVDSHIVSAAIAHCLASIGLKFMWVDELPYLVWQAWLAA